MFSLAFMLIGSFAFASTNAAVTPKAETIEVFTEKLITYEIDNPIMGKVTISVSENAFNTSNVDCGFPVSWDIYGSSGSFWLDCDGGTTMVDILDALFALFF